MNEEVKSFLASKFSVDTLNDTHMQIAKVVSECRVSLLMESKDSKESLKEMKSHQSRIISTLGGLKSQQDKTLLANLLRTYQHGIEVLEESRNISTILRTRFVDGKVIVYNDNKSLEYSYFENKHQYLVRTNLTDLCYATFFGSKDHIGINAGPAGTGKTESFKDFCKYLGKECEVYSCSDQDDILPVLDNKKCYVFDEFNRYSESFAKQVYEQALSCGLTKTGNYVCVTFNPGYSGRTKLDFMDQSTRTNMTVPDYQQIMRAMFAQEGFQQFYSLSKSLCKLFAKLKGGLKAHHFDFGMRKFKSIVFSAGRLNKIVGCECMATALSIKQLVVDLYPKDQRDQVLQQTLQHICGSSSLTDFNMMKNFTSYPYLNVVKSEWLSLYESMEIRHGNCVLTPEGKMFDLAQRFATFAQMNPCQNSNVYLMNLDQNIEDFINLFEKVMQDTQQHKKDKNYLVMYGVANPNILDNFMTLLDNNKVLCMANGKRYDLTSGSRIVFFFDSLKTASPAFVSRCGFVNMK